MTEGRTRDLSGQLTAPSQLACTIISLLITVIIILIITLLVLVIAWCNTSGCCLEEGDIRLTQCAHVVTLGVHVTSPG